MNKSNLRAPLSTVRGLGSARHGGREWFVGCLVSLALVPLTLWFVISILSGAVTLDAAGITAWLAQPFSGLMMALLMGVTVQHSKHGIQTIIEDYVHGEGAKFIAISLNALIHLVAAALSVFAILKLHFGV